MSAPKEPTQDEIARVVRSLRTYQSVMEKNGPHAVADCPWCGKKKHLYVNLLSGYWDCKGGGCEESGGLWKLADQVGITVRERVLVSSVSNMVPGLRRNRNAPGVTLEKVQAASARLFDPDDKTGQQVMAYVRKRGFDDDTIRRFNLCVMPVKSDAGVEPGVGIPYVDGACVPLIKMRNLADDKEHRRFSRTKGGHSGLFNADGIRGCKRVVLVEGELDAVSLWQMGIPDVASTSLGAKKDVPRDWLDALSSAEDIVLFYDDDEAGQAAVYGKDGSSGLLASLGTHRCRVARIPDELAERILRVTGKEPKDANDLLRASAEEVRSEDGTPSELVTHEEVRAIIDGAKGIESAAVVRPGEFRSVLEDQIFKGEQSLGFPLRWENLNRLIKGLRGKEVTAVIANTGHGKTTWITALAEILAEDKVPALVSSLENGAVSVVTKLFTRKAGRAISTLHSQADKEFGLSILDRLNETPYYVLNYSGRTSMSDVVEAFTFARKKYNVQVFVLDHLGFIARHERADPVQHQEQCMVTLVDLANKLDAHIFVVVHPNGSVPQNVIPTGDSIKGASAIKQDVSNVLCLWRPKDIVGKYTGREITVKTPDGEKIKVEMADNNVLCWLWKKRHDDAKTGMCLFDFDPRNLTYRPIASPGEKTNKDDVDLQSPPRQEPKQPVEDDPFACIEEHPQ